MKDRCRQKDKHGTYFQSVDLDFLFERVTILADLSIEELKNHLQF